MAVSFQTWCVQGRRLSCAASPLSPDVLITVAEQFLFLGQPHILICAAVNTTSGEGIIAEGHRNRKEPQSKGRRAGSTGGLSGNGIPDLLRNIFLCHICLDLYNLLLVVFNDLHPDVMPQDGVTTASVRWQNSNFV